MNINTNEELELLMNESKLKFMKRFFEDQGKGKAYTVPELARYLSELIIEQDNPLEEVIRTDDFIVTDLSILQLHEGIPIYSPETLEVDDTMSRYGKQQHHIETFLGYAEKLMIKFGYNDNNEKRKPSDESFGYQYRGKFDNYFSIVMFLDSRDWLWRADIIYVLPNRRRSDYHMASAFLEMDGDKILPKFITF